MNTKKEKVMVFGVFDNLHDGHRFLLQSALKDEGQTTLLFYKGTHAKALKRISSGSNYRR
jgi:phosphopantetheine adenylyltransferase